MYSYIPYLEYVWYDTITMCRLTRKSLPSTWYAEQACNPYHTAVRTLSYTINRNPEILMYVRSVNYYYCRYYLGGLLNVVLLCSLNSIVSVLSTLSSLHCLLSTYCTAEKEHGRSDHSEHHSSFLPFWPFITFLLVNHSFYVWYLVYSHISSRSLFVGHSPWIGIKHAPQQQ